MNITFDPLNLEEVRYVRNLLGTSKQITVDISAEMGEMLSQALADPVPVTPASAVPLPPAAPSTAAADVFPTVPVAPSAGPAVATSVPPPPVPAPPVPAAPAGATSPVVLDKNGLPWDERIHSGTKAVNADGSWRQRRGLNNPEYVAEIEAELRALLTNPVPAAPVSAVPLPPVATATTQDGSTETPRSGPAVAAWVPIIPEAPEVPNVARASSPVPTAPIPTPPVPPAPTAAAGIATAISFAELMSKVTKCLQSGKVTEADVHAALDAVNLGPNEIGKLAKPGDESATNRLCVAAILDEKTKE